MRTRDLPSHIQYPAGFAQPLRASYTVTPRMVVARNQMQSGWMRARRIEPYRFRAITAEFRMSSEAYWGWHEFVHTHGFKWVAMNLQVDGMNPHVSPHVEQRLVRFTGNTNMSYVDWNVIQVSAVLELYHDPDNPEVPVLITPPDSGISGGGDRPPGDGGSSLDPAGTIDMTDPPAQIKFLVSDTSVHSQPFRTHPSEDAFGHLSISSPTRIRAWISSTPNGVAISSKHEGQAVSLRWSQSGLVLGSGEVVLTPDSRYFYNVEVASGVGTANVTVEAYST